MSSSRTTQLVDAGLWLKLSGDEEGARRLFEQALKLDPQYARARELLEALGGGAPSAPPPVKPVAASSPFERKQPPSPAATMDSDWGLATGFESDEPKPPVVPPIAPLISDDEPLGAGFEAEVELGDGFSIDEDPPIALGELEESVEVVMTPPPRSRTATPVPATARPPAAPRTLTPPPNLSRPMAAPRTATPAPNPARPPAIAAVPTIPPVMSPMPSAVPAFSPATTPSYGNPKPSSSLESALFDEEPAPPVFEPAEPAFEISESVVEAPPPFSFSEPAAGDPPPFSFSEPVAGEPPPFSFSAPAVEPAPPPFSFSVPSEPPSPLEVETDLSFDMDEIEPPPAFSPPPPPPPPPPSGPVRDNFDNARTMMKVQSAWDSPSNPGIDLSKFDLAPNTSSAMDMVGPLKTTRTPPPTRNTAQEVETLLRGAKELLELDDHSGAMELILKAELLAPNHAEVTRLKTRSEHTLLAMYESKLGDLSATPRVKLKEDDVIWLNLDHRAGFVLAQIDGTVTYEDLFAVSGMSRLDTARILAQLIEQRVIAA